MKLLVLFMSSLFLTVNAHASIDEKELGIVCAGVTKSEVENYNRLISNFKNNSLSPNEFDHSEDGLQRFLDQTGIKHFSAKEITLPHSDEGAANCGVTELVPPQCIWKNAAAVLTVMDQAREEIQAPITFRNWWRPACYNSLVGGAKESDHLLSKAFDFDFNNSKERAIAQKIICEKLWKKNENIQIGIGCTSLHVGLGSPKGKRYWTYPGLYENCKVKTLDDCWDL
jgi:hypothetical protein